MSLQPPFFGKRPAGARPLGATGPSTGTATPASSALAVVPAQPAAHAVATVPPASPLPEASRASVSPPLVAGAPINEGGSKLTVGPNIKLKGVEITDCDTLVVEGTVEATMDSRVMHITEIGAFKGNAQVDYAEIHGAFNGELIVREKLVIYATGRVGGKIRYGKLVIQEGGQMMGDIQFGAAG